MHALADSRTIPATTLPDEAAVLRGAGWRFVTASCIPREGGAWTVLYHFEQGEQLTHLRVEVGQDGSVPSIGDAYPASFLVENEMRDIQGLRVTGMSIDYGGHLYRDFDTPESLAQEPGEGATIAPAIQLAAALRLDACVPIVDGRELRDPASRVPNAADPLPSEEDRP